MHNSVSTKADRLLQIWGCKGVVHDDQATQFVDHGTNLLDIDDCQ